MPENQTPGQAGSLPAEDNSDSTGETITMTKAELETLVAGKLKGSGKEIKKLQDELSKFRTASEQAAAKAEEERRAKLAEEGKKDEIINLLMGEKEGLSKQAAEYAERLKAFEERESMRLAALEERNAARVKALPKSAQSIVPKELSGDSLADYLSNLEKLVVDNKLKVFGGGSVSMDSGNQDPWERAKDVGNNFLFGRKK